MKYLTIFLYIKADAKEYLIYLLTKMIFTFPFAGLNFRQLSFQL